MSDPYYNTPKADPTIPFMDRWLTLAEAAAWLQMRPCDLSARSKGGAFAQFPGVWVNSRVVRFSPRIIICKLAQKAGVHPDVIAASMSRAA